MTIYIQSPDSWQMSDRERANLQQVTLYNSVQSLSEIWPLAAKHYHQTIALHDPHAKPEVKFTYAELNEQIQKFAAGLQSLGVVPTENEASIPPRVALFAENSPRWMIADQGIIVAGEQMWSEVGLQISKNWLIFFNIVAV